MKYYLLAGEASGDLHGAYLMQAIKRCDPDAKFRYWGGDRMATEGGELVVHYGERAFMGFIEIVRNLKKLLGFISRAKQDIAQWEPDRLIFIDNSGFNLRIAKWAKPAGFNTHYYISPQVWASRSGRVKTIKASIDRMYVVLPFVEDFYQQYDYPVEYVGHPLLDVVQDHQSAPLFPKEKIIALLPGSRSQEISLMLPIMLAAAARFPEYRFIIAQAPAQNRSFYEGILAQSPVQPPRLEIIPEKTYAILQSAHAALVTSGTATLETALFDVPLVVCYKGSSISYAIARRIVKVKYISLVNLILDEPLLTELVQNDLTVDRLSEELKVILKGPARENQLSAFKRLRQRLGGAGAPDRAAAIICAPTQK